MTLSAPKSRSGRLALVLAIIAALVAIGALLWPSGDSRASSSASQAIGQENVSTDTTASLPTEHTGLRTVSLLMTDTAASDSIRTTGSSSANRSASTAIDPGGGTTQAAASDIDVNGDTAGLAASFPSETGYAALFVMAIALGALLYIRRQQSDCFGYGDIGDKRGHRRTRHIGILNGRVAANPTSMFVTIADWARPLAILISRGGTTPANKSDKRDVDRRPQRQLLLA
jgi:hypothetical protein